MWEFRGGQGRIRWGGIREGFMGVASDIGFHRWVRFGQRWAEGKTFLGEDNCVRKHNEVGKPQIDLGSKWQLLSRVQLFATLWTVACQAPLSMEFSRQEYWSGLPFPPPGDLPDPGIESGSPALQADSLLSELLGILGREVLFHFSGAENTWKKTTQKRKLIN